MKVTQNPSLGPFTTFGVSSSASLLLTLETEEDLLSLPRFNPDSDLVLGGGSNVLLVSDVPGTVFHNRIMGKEVLETHDEHAWIEVGAGENWHDLVSWTLNQGLSGLENLSLIPGLVGAAPIQNIGAYGVELADVLESVTAWDLQSNHWVTFTLPQCELAYRDSRFKSREPDRYLICSVRLRLEVHFRPRLEYAGLEAELQKAGVMQPSARDVSEAVVRIRQQKLPDPAVTGNAGSFFKNPVLDQERAASLQDLHPQLPAWRLSGDEVKLSAAWMIEHCGFKGYREGNAGVSARHALVLLNHGSATGMEILKLARNIQNQIYSTFGVHLEPEPRIIEFKEHSR